MDLSTTTTNALTTFQLVKRVRCAEGPGDLGPMLHLVFPGDRHHVVPIPGREIIPAVIQAVAAEMDAHPLMVVSLADVYHLHRPGETRPGAARDAFLAGDPDATEALSAVGVDSGSDEIVTLVTPYTYRGDRLRFSQTSRWPFETGGAVVDLIREGVTLC